MGNYNCKECITKEANFINELLLDTNLLSPDEPSTEEPKQHESKIKQKKSNRIQPIQEDIKKILENEELSIDQKKFVEKIIKKNSVDIYLKNSEKKDEQNKIIEKQKEQILPQQKLLEENKQKQNSIKENINNNIRENKSNKSNSKYSDNIPDVKITTLEPIAKTPNVEGAIIIENSPNIEIERKDSIDSPQDDDIKIEIKKDENEDTKGSKKFNINSYEPNNNDNNNMDYLFEKNTREDEPQDTIREEFRKPIIPKTNNGNDNIEENEVGPRDSHRKKESNVISDDNMNGDDNSKIPLNRGENGIQKNNIKVINNNNNGISLNKNIINNNKNNNKNQQFFSPEYKKDLKINPVGNNNIKNENLYNNNIEIGRNAVTLGPYLNQVEEIKNSNTTGPVIDSLNRDKDELAYYQEGSQREMEMTISERENPLLMSDDRNGNMNYLEKRYEAYQNKMRLIYEDENV